MNLRSFLFTKHSPQRSYRHIAFWFISILPFFLLDILAYYTKYVKEDFGKFMVGQVQRFPDLLVDILFTYTVAYFVIPYYQKKKNTVLLVLQLSLFTALSFVGKAVVWYACV